MKWLGIAGLTFGTDYAIKRYLERKRKVTDEPKELFEGKVLVRRHTNEGGAMDRLIGRPKLVRNLSAAAFGGIVGSFLHVVGKPGRTLQKLGLALMLGGGASNFYDRCTRDGVTDYLSVVPKKDSWVKNVIFNLADVAIFGGLFFTIIGILFGKKD